MLEIKCPWCGPRAQSEFSYGGQAHRSYPNNNADFTDKQWGNYLFIHDNTRGTLYEQWCHCHGCRRWFNVARDTTTNEILAIYDLNQPKPDFSNQENSHINVKE
ncbi:sarcosine oxidase subunit delta [Facilibium subflavum]|uniref:sarcosine oxidase subunit delta n=1 Tax=Facilibium subflavum TaxID=2219058 RepID=UPI000E649A5C|nr:sarcosine oxidase subunit delta [Facilibium subflavum]